MVKTITAAALACLYTVSAAWLVRYQGNEYRKSLRAANPVASPGEVTEPPVPAAPHTADPTAPEKPSRPEPPIAVASAAPTPASVTAAADPGSSTTPSAPRPAPTSGTPATTSSEVAVTETTRRPDHDAFWDEPFLTKPWGPKPFVAADGPWLGSEASQVVFHTQRRQEGGPYLQRVNEVKDRILPNLKNGGNREFTFTVLDSDEVNAFSLPGDFIYLSRGLLDWIGEDRDNELEFVLAHEVAHLELGHPVWALNSPTLREKVNNPVRALYFVVLPLAYPDAKEFEADACAAKQLKASGRSTHDILAFLRRFRGYAEAQGFNDGRASFKPGPDSDPPDNHYRAHPAAYERVKRVEKLLTTGAPPAK